MLLEFAVFFLRSLWRPDATYFELFGVKSPVNGRRFCLTGAWLSFPGDSLSRTRKSLAHAVQWLESVGAGASDRVRLI
jgi:hypothetical protein